MGTYIQGLDARSKMTLSNMAHETSRRAEIPVEDSFLSSAAQFNCNGKEYLV